MQRKCHRCDRLYTPIDRAGLEKAFEQTGHYKPSKSMSGEWEEKQQKQLLQARRTKERALRGL